MSKVDYLAGFVKEAQHAGLGEEDITALWKYATEYPPFAEYFNKLADAPVTGYVDPNTLGTQNNLAGIKKQQSVLDLASSQVGLNAV